MVKPEDSKNTFWTPLMQNAIESALPHFVTAEDTAELYLCAEKIAEAFERGKTFEELMKASDFSFEYKLLESFIKNTQLLLEKTWVEKYDGRFKEETIYKLGKICGALQNSEKKAVYKENFSSFFGMLKDLVFLLFGANARNDDFLEYALRIDINFGFFWYYITKVSEIKIFSEEKAKIAVLLAVIFLANF